MDCNVYQDKGLHAPDEFQREAYATWKKFYHPPGGDEKFNNNAYINGTLSCFCEDQYKQLGYQTVNENYN